MLLKEFPQKQIISANKHTNTWEAKDNSNTPLDEHHRPSATLPYRKHKPLHNIYLQIAALTNRRKDINPSGGTCGTARLCGMVRSTNGIYADCRYPKKKRVKDFPSSKNIRLALYTAGDKCHLRAPSKIALTIRRRVVVKNIYSFSMRASQPKTHLSPRSYSNG